MSKRNTKVDAYLAQLDRWPDELERLRSIVLDCGLGETLKWGKPCYTYDDSNVAILYSMKDSCALGFLKGSLLKDDKGLLVAPGKHSQAMRRLHFESVDAIERSTAVIKRYVRAAIAVEKAGLEVDFKAKRELDYPPELEQAFTKNRALKQAFLSLTPGRKRGYVLHFIGAKQAATRAARIERCTPKILAGKGFNER